MEDEKEMSNPVSELIENAMKNISGMVDVNSVVGEPIKVDNDTVIICARATI